MAIEACKNYIFSVIKVEKDQYLIKNNEATLGLQKAETIRDLSVGENIDVFVYIDHNKGLQPTMKEPLIDCYNADFVEVVETKMGLGVFVNIGLQKDMLVSKDDLPFLKSAWPEKGDMLCCHLKVGRNQMIAKLASRFRMRDYFKPTAPLEIGDVVEAYVFYPAEEGVVLYTLEGHEIFVYFKHARENYRLGQKVEVTVKNKKDETHYNGLLMAQKEIQLDKDAEDILAYLTQENGTMPFTDKSDPEAIFNTFHMSKAAFKRAIGRLYKEGLVTLEQERTVLKEKD